MDDRSDRYAILGAGPAGLVMGRRLLEAGIPFETLDAANGIGGLWATAPANGPLYRNTHLISPKSVQAFADFPMPKEYPDFPHHSLTLRYLQQYAENFRLVDHVEFGARVTRVSPSGECWETHLENGSVRRYKGLLIATGKHEFARLPEFAGRFDGEIRHSRDYYDPVELGGRRVLVIGAGQSAIDLIAEAAVVAERVFHSMRRGLFSMPRYLFGKPFEEHLQSSPPFREASARLMLPLLKRLGEAPPGCATPALDFRDGIIHPTVGRDFFRFYQQGDVMAVGPVAELSGRTVRFTDGSTEKIDLIYCATGYRLEYPFIEHRHLNWPDHAARPDLYLYTFHPESDSVLVLGMMQPLGSHWTTYDEQAQLVTAFLKLQERGGRRLEDFRRRRRLERPRLDGGNRYYGADRKPTADLDKISFRDLARNLRRWMGG